MKSIKFCLFLVLFVSSDVLIAQDSPFAKNYQQLTSVNPLPDIVTTKSSKKFRKDLERIDDSAKRKVKKSQKKFFLESNFVIDRLLKSGTVLYNDPVSRYVTEVAQKVLKNQPEIKDKIQVFTIKSSEVNAFTTDQGYVFVTMGLLARLETEAQLAYILCHEFVHYKNEHSLNFTLLGKRSRNNAQGNVYPKKQKDRELFRYTFAKEQETEADKEGLELFLKSDYGTNSLEKCFDILGHGYLPFGDKVFDISFFETDYLKFPESLILNEISTIKPLDIDESDERSTHPNTAKRQKETLEIVEKQGHPNGNDFLISSERFADVKERARFEICNLHLDNEEYFNSMYASYLLLNKYPDNLYLKKTLLSGMYAFAQYKNNGLSHKAMVGSIDGGSQPLLFFLQKIKPKDFNLIAAAKAWELHEEYPNDELIKMMAEDLIPQLIDFHNFSIKDIQTTYTPTKGEGSEQFYQKIKDVRLAYEKNKKSSINNPKPKMDIPLKIPFEKEENSEELVEKQEFENLNTDAILAPFLKNKNFITAWEAAEKIVKNTDKTINKVHNERTKKWYKRKGLALNQNKILVISPRIIDGYFGPNIKDEIDFLSSEKGNEKFRKSIINNANAHGVETVFLDSDNLEANDQKTLNELSTVYGWLNAKNNFLSLRDRFVGRNFYQEKMNELANKYDVDYILFTGVVNDKTKRNVLSGAFKFLMIVMPTTSFRTIVYGSTEHHFYGAAINIRSGETYEIIDRTFRSTNEKYVFDLYLYDLFNQVKSKR